MTKITNDKLFSGDFLEPQKKSMQDLIDLTIKLQKEFKDLLASQKATLKGDDTKSTEGLKKRKQAITLVNAVSKEMVRLDKQRVTLTAQLLSAESDEAKNIQRLRVAKQQLNKVTKQEAVLNSKLTTEYQKQSTRLNQLRAKYKDLILTEGKFSAETRRVGEQVTRLDTKLKAVDSASGQFQRNVGNYPQTFAKAGAALRRFGLAFGGIAIFKNALSTVTNFEQAQADLGAISQSSGEELEKLSKQAKDLGATTQFTATEITNLQIELAKLGFSTEDIVNSTEAVQDFAAATGADLPSAAALAGSALRAFGLDASDMDRVVSTLGVATTKSALDFQKLETGLSTVAPVAKAFGFTIEDTTALLGQLANSGFDASSAATATRNILLNLADSGGDLAQQLGRPIKSADDLAEGLAELQAKGIDLATSLELTDKRSVAAFNTFLEGSGTLVEFRDSITDANDELQKMAEDRLNTVQGQAKLLASAWEGLLIDIAEGNGIFGGLKDILGFVARNLRSIIKVAVAGVVAWGSYRLALKLVNKETGKFIGLGLVKRLRSMVKTVALMTKGTRGMALGFRRVGDAIRSIPFAAVISGLTTAITLVLEFTGATDDSTESQNKYNDALQETIKLEEERAGRAREVFERIKNVANLNKRQLDVLQSDIEVAIAEIEDKLTTAQQDLGTLARTPTGQLVNVAGLQELNTQLESETENLAKVLEVRRKTTELSEEERGIARQNTDEIRKRISLLKEQVEAESKITTTITQGITESATGRKELGQFNVELSKLKAGLDAVGEAGKNIKDEGGIILRSKKTTTTPELTELAKLQKALKDINDQRANELILQGQTVRFEMLTAEAKLRDQEIKDLLKILELNGRVEDSRAREIAIIRAEISAQKELSTMITEKTNLEEFGQAKAQNARDLAKRTAQININFNQRELEVLEAKAEAGKAEAKDLEKINQLKLETLQLEQQILDIVLDERLENFRKAELVLISEFNTKVLNGTFKTNEEKIRAEEDLQKELLKIKIKALTAELQFTKPGSIEEAEKKKQIQDAQIALEDLIEDSNKRIADKEKALFNERLRATQEFAEEIRKIEERRINKQIEEIDREIEASQRREDMLTQLAVQGNQQATESISAEIRKQEELQRKKDALEKKKARQKAIVDSLDLLEQKIENDEVDPVTSTIKDMTKLFAVIATAIPGFYKGTKGTVKEALGGPQLSGRDGYIVRVDGSEKVLNPELSRKTGNMTTDEIVDRAVMHKMGVHEDHQFIEPIIREIHQPYQTPQAMLQKLDQIEKAINNQPVYLGGEFVNNYEYWQERIKQGNKIVKNLHKTDSINGK